jgi:hypothetical protein
MPILYGPGLFGAQTFGANVPKALPAGLPRNRARLTPPVQARKAAGLVSETIVFGPRVPIARVTYAAVRYEASAVVPLPMLVGNAVAAGSQARIGANLRLAMLTGNAVAAGSQARVGANLTLPMLTGNAVAAGLTATIPATLGLRVTFAAVQYEAAPLAMLVGNAVAAGSQARIGANLTLPMVVGNAVANGRQAQIGANVRLPMLVGNAVAAGSQARVGANTRLPMSAGNAIAAGANATVSIFSLRVTYAAALYQAAPLEFHVGNAVAAGPQGAEVIVETAITFDAGNAVADGPQGTTVNVDQVIYCDVGNAIGCGYTVGGLYWRPAYSKPGAWGATNSGAGAWMAQAATNTKWADRTRAHC